MTTFRLDEISGTPPTRHDIHILKRYHRVGIRRPDVDDRPLR